ncbi:hypothetical protein GpartN1_g4866.t1 [Galdieria partita]|uniref:glucan 1,4-alpha-glucosidase n=1 Tax=Galdieria partita TaxID=83374 RepID=A0A9C7URU6_9RHOD|nr:hypothetical protein GpartN1_g4866.t1 [Galdieria partita]
MGSKSHFTSKLVVFASILVLLLFHSSEAQSWKDSLERWIPKEMERSFQGIFYNIDPPGGIPGSVTAADSHYQPDYYYNWIRDAAITMDVVVTLYEKAKEPSQVKKLEDILKSYVHYNYIIQRTPNPTGNLTTGGLGAAHYLLNGSAFTGSWCSVENDGPALRAVAVMRFAKEYLRRHGDLSYVKKWIFNNETNPPTTVTRADLDYIVRVWPDPCCGPWETFFVVHFWDQLLIRKALLQGAKFAEMLGYMNASSYYTKQAKELTSNMSKFISHVHGVVLESIDAPRDTIHETFIDTSTILAVLYGYNDDGFYAPDDPYVMNTANLLRLIYKDLFPVNRRRSQDEGVLFGRFPNDNYDGIATGNGVKGNPWFLCTLGMARYYFELAKRFSEYTTLTIHSKWMLPLLDHLGSSHSHSMPPVVGEALNHFQVGETLQKAQLCQIAKALLTEADKIVYAVYRHVPETGMLTEEINRFTGFEQGAKNLTWSYDSFVTAIWSRKHSLKAFHSNCPL